MSETEDLIRDLIASGAPANLVARVAKLAARAELLEERRARKQVADRRRVADKRAVAEPEPELKFDDASTAQGDCRATQQESRDSLDMSGVAAPSPAPLPSSSPPHPPNNYLPPTPILIDDEDRASDRKTKSMISEEAHLVAEAIGREAGFDRATWPPGWCGAAWTIQKYLDQGYPGEIVKLGAIRALRRKRDGPPANFAYFEKPIAAAFAEHKRPIPEVIVGNPKPVEVRNGHPSEPGAFEVARKIWENIKAAPGDDHGRDHDPPLGLPPPRL